MLSRGNGRARGSVEDKLARECIGRAHAASHACEGETIAQTKGSSPVCKCEVSPYRDVACHSNRAPVTVLHRQTRRPNPSPRHCQDQGQDPSLVQRRDRCTKHREIFPARSGSLPVAFRHASSESPVSPPT